MNIVALPGMRMFRRVLWSWNYRPFVTVTVIFALWQLAWSVGAIPQNGFPSATQTLRALWELSTQPFAGQTLPAHVADSLRRWSLGLLLAVLVGVPFGAALGWFPTFRALTRPVFEFLRYIPPLAWVPLTILAFGPSLTAEVSIVFVGAIAPIVINTWTGVVGVDPILVDAGRTLGARYSSMLVTIALPASTLSLLTGIRVGVSNGWAALIGAELISAQSGLGFIIINSQTAGRPDDILAGMVVIGAMGLSIDALFRRLTQRATRWQGTSL